MQLSTSVRVGSYATFAAVLYAALTLLTELCGQANAQRNERWRDGALRLVGGHSPHEGTVLIYHWSRWGRVCDEHWDIRDANVVCNELGYPGAKEAVTQSRFGQGRREFCISL